MTPQGNTAEKQIGLTQGPALNLSSTIGRPHTSLSWSSVRHARKAAPDLATPLIASHLPGSGLIHHAAASWVTL
uniref:Uncharacterized protein n=1 Tax=Knipowitschia caucasica TaxID=637954 RepID=A0AAV2KAS1_KNICA